MKSERLRTNKPWILWPSLVAGLTIMTIYLNAQGRLWIASSGHMYFWMGDAFGADNSQHLFDPYSFSHFLHGLIFFFILKKFFIKFSLQSRFVASVFLESGWEMLENSAIIIIRYRDATAALGYTGDTIYNSFGDLISCSLGFIVAGYTGWKRSIVLFIAVEIILLIWIKDNLTLNIIMLICPIDAIKEWQLAG